MDSNSQKYNLNSELNINDISDDKIFSEFIAPVNIILNESSQSFINRGNLSSMSQNSQNHNKQS